MRCFGEAHINLHW